MDTFDAQVVENVVDKIITVFAALSVGDNPLVAQNSRVGDRVGGHRRDQDVVRVRVVQVADAVVANVGVILKATHVAVRLHLPQTVRVDRIELGHRGLYHLLVR